MKTEQIIKTLQNFNAWNQGEDQKQDFSLNDTINAIDAAIERLQELEKERDEARNKAVEFRDFYHIRCEEPVTESLPWEEGSE